MISDPRTGGLKAYSTWEKLQGQLVNLQQNAELFMCRDEDIFIDQWLTNYVDVHFSAQPKKTSHQLHNTLQHLQRFTVCFNEGVRKYYSHTDRILSL